MKKNLAIMRVFVGKGKLSFKICNLLILITLVALLVITYQKHDTRKFLITLMIAIAVCIWQYVSSYYILYERVKKASIIYQKFWSKIGGPIINDNDDLMKKYEIINKYCLIEWNADKSRLIDKIRLLYAHYH